MTKEETLASLAHLSAFYGEGKSDVKMMVEAWHEVIGEYDYYIVKRAIIEFAKNDTRDYASFPPAGRIIEEIKKQNGMYNRIYNELLKSTDYESLSEEAKKIIKKEIYDNFMNRNYEQKLNCREDVIKMLRKNDLQLPETRKMIENKNGF